MNKVNVRYTSGDTVVCEFNPFKKYIKFTRKSSGESCTLNINLDSLDMLYPCVRISYSSDSVEIINEK